MTQDPLGWIPGKGGCLTWADEVQVIKEWKWGGRTHYVFWCDHCSHEHEYIGPDTSVQPQLPALGWYRLTSSTPSLSGYQGMRLVLKGSFSNIIIEGNLSCSPFISGDSFEVFGVRPTPYGDEEWDVLLTHPDWNDGKPFIGIAFPWDLEIEGWPDSWEHNEDDNWFYPKGGAAP